MSTVITRFLLLSAALCSVLVTLLMPWAGFTPKQQQQAISDIMLPVHAHRNNQVSSL